MCIIFAKRIAYCCHTEKAADLLGTHENRSLSPPANFLDEREGRKSRSKKQHTATLKYGEQAGAYKKGSSKRHPRASVYFPFKNKDWPFVTFLLHFIDLW